MATLGGLLGWATASSAEPQNAAEDPQTEAVLQNNQAIDPKWLDIMMGKQDAVRMTECVDTACNITLVMTDRINALDEMELLVESLDNASDVSPLGLWPRIISLTHDEDPEIRMHACWIVGTAAQNNERTQLDILNHNGLFHMVACIKNDTDETVKRKAVYATSCLIRGNTTVIQAFIELDGFEVLVDSIKDGEPIISTRIVFLITQLLHDESIRDLISLTYIKLKILEIIVELIPSTDNVALLEEGINFLVVFSKYQPLDVENLYTLASCAIESLQKSELALELDEIRSLASKLRL